MEILRQIAVSFAVTSVSPFADSSGDGALFAHETVPAAQSMTSKERSLGFISSAPDWLKSSAAPILEVAEAPARR